MKPKAYEISRKGLIVTITSIVTITQIVTIMSIVTVTPIVIITSIVTLTPAKLLFKSKRAKHIQACLPLILADVNFCVFLAVFGQISETKCAQEMQLVI